MAYKSRKFLGKDSIKLVAWQSEYVKPSSSSIFGEKDAFTWHEIEISNGYHCIALDEKEATALLPELISFLVHVDKEEKNLKSKPTVIKANKKGKK